MRLSIVLCLVVLCGAWSALAADLELQVLTDGPKFRRDLPWPEKSPIYDPAKKEIRLCGARNEVLGFQICLRARKDKIAGVNIQVTDLAGENGSKGAIPAKNVELFREWFVLVETPSFTGDIPGLGKGEYPDPLVPLNAPKYCAPFDLETGKAEIIFGDIYVPHGTPAGAYRGTVTLNSNSGVLEKLSLALTVWNFTLPEETHFKSTFYYEKEFIRWGFRSPASDDEVKIEEDLFRLAQRHRINLPSDTYMKSSAADWEKWAARYGKYLDGSAFTDSPGKGVPMYMWRTGYDVAASDEAWREKTKIAADFLEKKGWLDRFVISCFDEPKPAAYPQVRKVGLLAREASGGRLKHFLAGAGPDPAYQDFVDIWDGCWAKKDLPLLEERRKAGQRVWYAGAFGAPANPCIDDYPYGNRSWPWVGWKYGFEGFEMWHAVYWVDKFNLPNGQRKDVDRNPEKYLNVWKNPAPLTFDEGRKRGGKRYKEDILQNGSTSIFYPGYDVGLPRQCVASIKAKDYRRGAQDYEYLWLLNQAGEKKTIEDALAKIYNPDAVDLARGGSPKIKTGSLGVTTDELIWEAARMEMGKRLDALGEKK